jgi:hypothetical protein
MDLITRIIEELRIPRDILVFLSYLARLIIVYRRSLVLLIIPYIPLAIKTIW